MTIPSLPTELLRLILRSATFTDFDLEGSIRGIDHDWFTKLGECAADSIKTKITTALVSRQFRLMCSEFLYEHMLICDLRVIALMDRLIRSSSCDRGPCQTIKYVFVDTDAAFKARMSSKLANLLHLCHNLRGFSWIDCSKHNEDNKELDEEVMAQIPRNIQFFAWNGRVLYADLAPFLCEASVSLRVVHIAEMQRDWAFPIPLATPTFPCLTDLRVTVDQPDDPLRWLSGWSMPSLRNLYLSQLSIDRDSGIQERILSPVARNLRCLRFGNGATVDASLLSKILLACPYLQEFCYHLLYAIDQHSPWTSNVTHSSLKVITVSCYTDYTWIYSVLRDHFRGISKINFPLVDVIDVKAVTFDGSRRQYLNISLRRLSDDFSSAELIVVPSADNSPL